MKWRDRNRRHDDAHLPLGGRGNRARSPKRKAPAVAARSESYIETRKIIGWDRESDLPIYEAEKPAEE